MARPRRMPIRIVFYKEGGRWIARCLEFDLLGDGDTIQAALEQLVEAIFIQIETSFKYDNPANLFTPADGKYFEMFSAGEDIAHGELQIRRIERDDFVIDNQEYRQYADEDDLQYAEAGGLVPA